MSTTVDAGNRRSSGPAHSRDSRRNGAKCSGELNSQTADKSERQRRSGRKFMNARRQRFEPPRAPIKCFAIGGSWQALVLQRTRRTDFLRWQSPARTPAITHGEIEGNARRIALCGSSWQKRKRRHAGGHQYKRQHPQTEGLHPNSLTRTLARCRFKQGSHSRPLESSRSKRVSNRFGSSAFLNGQSAPGRERMRKPSQRMFG